MALLQASNAVFYHPLDNLTEALQSQVWTGTGELFAAGKVSNALTRGAVEATTPAVYPTAVGATRLTFAVWTKLPSTPLIGPPPWAFRETDRTILTAIGVRQSLLGGFT